MRHRQRELPTPDDDTPVALVQQPTRWAVRVRVIAYVLVGLAVAASLMSVYLTYQAAQDSAAQAAAVDRRLSVLEEDLAERTRQRDAERDAAEAQADRDREQFRVRFCEVLAELSATFPNLDQIREALGCAQPVADVPPSAQAPPEAPATGPVRPAPSSAAPAPAQPSTPAGPAPAPPSEPPDGPGLICGLLPLLC